MRSKRRGGDVGAAAVHLGLGDHEGLVQAHPARVARVVPLARADAQPVVLVAVLLAGGDEQAEHVVVLAPDDHQGALLRRVGGHGDPHDLTGLGLAVHVGGVVDAPRDLGGRLDQEAGGDLSCGRAGSCRGAR